jgi:uncharacterized protein YggL (DUF469 family)
MATKTQKKPEWDELGFIMKWESEEMDEEELAEGFQHLIDNGHCWSLQGCYGRTAAALIEAGLCVDTHNRLGKNPQAN